MSSFNMQNVSIGLIGAATVYALGSYYRKQAPKIWKWGEHDDSNAESVTGKVIIITGANSGLGLETTYQLVKRNAIVIMACRDLESAKAAVREIQKRPGGRNGRMEPMLLDLSSLDSIRQFVADFKRFYYHLDTLINNAGVAVPFNKHQVTQDGFEINFGVNHLGHFLLTNLLLDLLKEGAPSRIVTVSSLRHEKGEIRLDDLNLLNLTPKEQRSINPYNNSKLMNVLFNRELANRLSGTGIHCYALCPGWVKTQLFRNSDLKFYHYIPAVLAAFLFMRNFEDGCQTILHCTLSKTCGKETGKFYRNCDYYVSSANLSEVTGKKLWEISDRLTGLSHGDH